MSKFKVKDDLTVYTLGSLHQGIYTVTWTDSEGQFQEVRYSEDYVEKQFNSGNWSYHIGGIKEAVEPLVKVEEVAVEYTGGSSSYYKVGVLNPTTRDSPYTAECNDIIEALGLTFTEGNIFKAIWRIAADRNGKKKKGNNSVYDAEKVVFFAERLLIQEKSKQ